MRSPENFIERHLAASPVTERGFPPTKRVPDLLAAAGRQYQVDFPGPPISIQSRAWPQVSRDHSRTKHGNQKTQ